jgi:hypothetical protein
MLWYSAIDPVQQCVTPSLQAITALFWSHQGCAVFATFFILFDANLSEYGSYSLQILAQIRTQMFDLIQKIHVAANFHFGAKIRLRFSHTGEYLLKNICLEKNIRKTSSELKRIFSCLYRIKANIRLQIFAYRGIFERNIRFRLYSFRM